jgi:hypothetical protein
MLFEQPMEHEKTIQEQEVWSAIRYLDPDQRDDSARHRGVRRARVDSIATAILALLLIIGVVWALLRL